jgi:CRP-like cAMP-binding protein
MSGSVHGGVASRIPIPANGPASQMQIDGIPIAVAADVRARTIEPQSGIFYEGHVATSAFRIVTGEVSIVRSDGAPGKYRQIERLGPNQYFGESGFLGSNKRNVTAMTVSRTLILEMDIRGFEAELMTIEEGYRAIVWLLLEFRQTVPPRSAWRDGKVPDSARPLIKKMSQSMAEPIPELTRIPGAFLRGLYTKLVEAAIDRLPES